MPYHCLQRCGEVLVAASTSQLHTFKLSDGTKLSSWTHHSAVMEANTNESEEHEVPILQTEKSENSSIDIVIDSEPPNKKRRLSSETADATEQSVKKQKHNGNRKKGPKLEKPASVACLTSTRDGQHVIAVTGEDKTVRVLEHDGSGNLSLLSERTMPKRPCAIALTGDESTIILADKFGDVYSIPLQYTAPPEAAISSPSAAKVVSKPEDDDKPFISAANNLTIHTQRNRQALEHQLRQRAKNPEPTGIKFEHKQLIGHVSMLTDVASFKRAGKAYIATADRDEHIRISRGIPQTHVIEQFCLGHKDFVTRICFPESLPEVMVSGDGGGELKIWRWEDGVNTFSINVADYLEDEASNESKTDAAPKASAKTEHKEDAEDATQEQSTEEISTSKPIITGIHELGSLPDSTGTAIAVTCEATPTILIFSIPSPSSPLHLHQRIDLNANPLAICADALTGQIIVSFDILHEAGSTDVLRSKQEDKDGIAALLSFSRQESGWGEDGVTFDVGGGEDGVGIDEGKMKEYRGLWYGLRNLRKRGGEGGGEE